MPPRFAYWTILIDNAPTAFRARNFEELLPTVNQLKRKNENVTVKWFSGGQLWDSPEHARETRLAARPKVVEKRGREWRPGGEHKDPRARFDKKEKKDRRDFKPAGPGDRPRKPFGQKPFGKRPFGAKPSGDRRFGKPWQNREGGDNRPREGGKPFGKRPFGAKPFGKPAWPKRRSSEGGRPFGAKPPGGPRPRSGEGGWQNRERGQHGRPEGGKPFEKRPYGAKPFRRPGPPRDPRRDDKKRRDDE